MFTALLDKKTSVSDRLPHSTGSVSLPHKSHLTVRIVSVRFRARVSLRGEDYHSISVLLDLSKVFTIVDAEIEVAGVTDDDVEELIGIVLGEFLSKILSDIRTGVHECRECLTGLEGDVDQTFAIGAECNATG